jgi:probable phosphoglycerate mutase
MAIFLLIRHGKTDYVNQKLAGRIDEPLNGMGEKHAYSIAEAIGQLPIKAIYSSPLKRAIQTAEPLSQKIDVPVEISSCLTQVDFGEWEGMSFERLKDVEAWKAYKRNPVENHCPGGEKTHAVRQRVMIELTRLSQLHTPEDLIAIFSHGSIIRNIIAGCIGLPLENINQLVIYPGSISTLSYYKRCGKLLHLNQNDQQKFV